MAEPFLSEIRIVSFVFAPKGWALCNGQLLPISQNQALFSLLGTTFGGDGETTFALPDFRGRTPIHVGNGHTLGERGGEAAHALSLAEMPAHTHTVTASGAVGTARSPVDATWAANPANPYYSGYGDVAMSGAAVSPVGGGLPHTNMQPYLTLNFVIALQGIFSSEY